VHRPAGYQNTAAERTAQANNELPPFYSYWAGNKSINGCLVPLQS